jgi:hypothetical protein
MRLPSEVLRFEAERRRMAWFRRRRAFHLPPEVVFLLVVIVLALGLYALVSPRCPAASVSVAPQCADSSFSPCVRPTCGVA